MKTFATVITTAFITSLLVVLVARFSIAGFFEKDNLMFFNDKLIEELSRKK